MNKEQEKALAVYLRDLEERLSKTDYDWTTWVRGSLIGIAEMLEIQNETFDK